MKGEREALRVIAELSEIVDYDMIDVINDYIFNLEFENKALKGQLKIAKDALDKSNEDLHCADKTVGKADLGSRGQTKVYVQSAINRQEKAISKITAV